MRIKAIEVPDDAERLYYNFDHFSTENIRWVDVDTLPDAPEKSVIELPADLLKNLTTLKRQSGDDLQKFMNDVNQDGIHDGVQSYNTSNKVTDALLGEWWLGYAEFVPKKEPKFVIEVNMHDLLGNAKMGHIWQNEKHGELTPYVDEESLKVYNHKEFTEVEADKIVESLGGENGLLKPRKVEVE